jgi:hypothetical protein
MRDLPEMSQTFAMSDNFEARLPGFKKVALAMPTTEKEQNRMRNKPRCSMALGRCWSIGAKMPMMRPPENRAFTSDSRLHTVNKILLPLASLFFKTED